MIRNKAKQQQTQLWSNSTMCKLIFHQLAAKNLNIIAVQRSTCTASVIRYSMGQKQNYIIQLFDRPKSGLSGLKNIWPVIMTGDLLSVILSLETLTGIQTNLPWGQRFLSGMAVSIGKVVHVSCQSCSWYVCETNRLTSHVHDLVNSKRHARKKPLLKGKTNPISWNLTEVLVPGNKADTHLDEAPDVADSNKGSCRPP